MKRLQNPCDRSSRDFSSRWSDRERLALKIGLAAAIFVASVGAVAAGERDAARRAPGFSPSLQEGRSAAEQDRIHYDLSAPLGRMGLGADPAHPEGPGNFTF